jgi:hypothetical protein
MICFDTMLLIWGVQGQASSQHHEMVSRTKRYIASLAKANQRIMVPTPALTEYLQHFDDLERKRQLELLERHFLIASYNLLATYLAAGLARKTGRPESSSAVPRQCVKTDYQIIATAAVHGAKLLVTAEQEHFEHLAAGKIKISGVPDVHEQANLDLNP